MLRLLQRLGFRSSPVPFVPALPPGVRAYAIGDIHGRLDLLDELLRRVEADNAARDSVPVRLIFLGDLIDRGGESAQVVERLRTFAPDWAQLVFIAGNHEESFLNVLNGMPGVTRSWLSYGGEATLISYGMAADDLRLPPADFARALKAAVPAAHRNFIAGFAPLFRLGDYLFVHAGIRPGVPIPAQTKRDLRWIREDFLDDARSHGVMVIHGHTITEECEFRSNRIGIDTGAYRTGKLTALCLQGTDQWLLSTRLG